MRLDEVLIELNALDTERLLLRKMGIDDASELLAYAKDPDVAKYASWEPHKGIADARGYLATVVDAYRRGHPAPWAMISKENGKFIGTCGYTSWNFQNHRADIGFTLAKEYWAQGYVAEAVQRFVSLGFRSMELNRIESSCWLEDDATGRLLEDLGFQYEGILRGYILVKEQYCDIKMYAMLRSDWEKRRDVIQG